MFYNIIILSDLRLSCQQKHKKLSTNKLGYQHNINNLIVRIYICLDNKGELQGSA